MAEPSLAAVIGFPVSHSLSPAIFSFLAKAAKREVLYQRIECPPARLTELVRAVWGMEIFVGWNVTIPHKEAILRLLDHLSPEAQALGAANVVHFGKVQAVGHNTDVIGVRETLKERKYRARGKTVLLYGAGGAARAVAYTLGQEKAAEVAVWNRSRAHAEALVQRFSALFSETRFYVEEKPEKVEPSLLVNATPVGMKGFSGDLPFPTKVGRDTLAFDLIYRPAHTAFLKKAASRGMRTVGGLDMLIWQAMATWEIWFSRLPERAALKKRIVTSLRGL